MKGKVELEFELLTDKEAEEKPAGLGIFLKFKIIILT